MIAPARQFPTLPAPDTATPTVAATEKLLTLQDIRKAAQVTRWTCWKWIRDGKLRAVKIGGLVRVRESDWQRFLDQHTTGDGKGSEAKHD